MGHFWTFAAAAFLMASPAAAMQKSAAASPLTKAVTDAVDKHFLDYQEKAHVPGLAWAVVQNGRLVHTGFSGVQNLDTGASVDADTHFRIASMSKAFTALAILKLRDDGLLSLDALAETYAPELKEWRYPTTDSPRIRVRDLLHHVGGLVTDDPWGDRQQPLSEEAFTAMLREGPPLTRAPQLQYEYSNYGYAVLGRIIANVSGQSFDSYIKAEIMRPLGMETTGYEVAETPMEKRALGYRWENEAFSAEPEMAHGAFGSMGGVHTSVNDYARWVSFLLAGWPARDGAEQEPVKRATVREIAQGLNFPRMANRPGLEEADPPCAYPSAYGMGFILAIDCDLGPTLSHSGGFPGYGSNLLLMPEAGVGVFAFANRTYAGPAATVRLAALELERAGFLTGRAVPVSEPLAAAYKAAGAVYRAGDLKPIRKMLAMNFLMDRSEENWALELAGLKRQSGECRTDAPIAANGALTGAFSWRCENGSIEGRLLLAPTTPSGVQALRLSFTPSS
ncbi:MAG: serine hydrolase domain-containing protein [Amphiplicatus sp.]